MKKKKSETKETIWSKILGFLTMTYEKVLKPFLGGLWLFIKILAILGVFGFYLYSFSELVIVGITESSALHLAAGVAGYIVAGIVALLIVYEKLYKDDIEANTNIVIDYGNPWPKLRRDLQKLYWQVYDIKYDLRINQLGWKIDEVKREIRDLARSLKK